MGENNKKPSIRFAEFNDAWEQRKLEELGKIETGNTPATSNLEYYSDTGLLWITPTDITSNITTKAVKYLSNKGEKVARVIPANSTLCTCIASIGKNTFCPIKCAFNQQINALSPNNSNDPYFIFTDSYHWSITMKKGAGGLTFQIVNKTEFSSIETYIPAKQEQEKIGQLFYRLDSLITLHQRKCDQLSNVKKALLEKMFSSEGEYAPRIRFKSFTDAWEQRKLEELGKIETGNTPATSNLEYYSDTGLLWITPTDITSNITTKAVKYLSNKGEKVARVIPANSTLCTCIASIGKNTFCPIKCAFNQQINALSPNNSNDPYFIFTDSYHWSITMKKGAGGLTFQIVNKTEFSSIETYIPAKQEQEKIGQLFYRLDSLITLHQRKCEKLKNLKKSLLEKMFI